MASIQSRTTPSGERRWDVYYRGPDGKQRKKTYKRRVDAQRYANTVEADIVRHAWVDPQRGRQPFGEWAEKWIETTAHLKPKTRESYDSILRNHLIPEFGDRAIGSIDHPEVLTFLARLSAEGKGAGTVRNIRDVMRLVFKLAVRSGVLKNNPVMDIKAPRAVKQEMIFLTDDQFMALAEEIQDPPPLQRGATHREGGYPDYALLVRFAAYTGLRAGEIGALRVSRIKPHAPPRRGLRIRRRGLRQVQHRPDQDLLTSLGRATRTTRRRAHPVLRHEEPERPRLRRPRRRTAPPLELVSPALPARRHPRRTPPRHPLP